MPGKQILEILTRFSELAMLPHTALLPSTGCDPKTGSPIPPEKDEDHQHGTRSHPIPTVSP